MKPQPSKGRPFGDGFQAIGSSILEHHDMEENDETWGFSIVGFTGDQTFQT